MATTYGTASSYVWSQWTSDSSSTTACYNTWDQWHTSTTTSGSSGSTTDNIVWYAWSQERSDYDNSVKVSIRDNSGHVVWSKWVDQYDVSLEVYREQARTVVKEATEKLKQWKMPSAETIRAQNAQQEIRRVWNKLIADEKRQERDEAENVALELLLELVSEEEVERYKETGRLFVKGRHYDYVIKKDGGVYRIAKDRVIDFAKKKEAEGKFICVHPKNRFKYPDTDNVIALKMWIENKENAFLRIGNKHHTVSKIKDFDKVIGM